MNHTLIHRGFAIGLTLVFTLMIAMPSQAQTPPYEGTLQAADDNPVLSALPAPDCTTVPGNPFVNCSFEVDADFVPPSGWVVVNPIGLFCTPIVTLSAGASCGFGFFATSPTQGSKVAFTDFDGGGPGTIRLCQDVTLPSGALLNFDYRGAWDMTFGATLDRTFDVTVEPSGGGGALLSETLLTAGAGTTVLDTGSLQGSVDLSAAGPGGRRVCFDWFIPEPFTGPGQFQIDNVSVASVGQADLAIDKTVDNDTPAIGDSVTFTIDITHLEGGGVASVRVEDRLPSGTSYQASTTTQGSYNPSTGIWQVGSLTVGQTETLTIRAEVLTTAGITNTANIAFSNLPDPDTGNNRDSASLNAEAADLEVEKLVTEFENNNGTATASFLVTVSNEGPSDVDGVVVTDELSPDMTVLGITTSQGTPVVAGSTITWAVGSIDDGDSATMSVTVSVPQGGSLLNTAEVTAASLPDPDSDPGDGEGDDFAAATAGPRAVPDFVPGGGPGGIISRGDRATADLSLTKDVTVEGSTATYTIMVENLGPQSTAKVEVTDHLPDCLTYVSSTADRGAYDPDTWVWTIGALKVGEKVTLEIVADITDACVGDVTNTATITSSSLPDPSDFFNLFDDPALDNNSDDATFSSGENAARVLDGTQTVLGVNYPNPFNPTTLIPFSLTEAADVSIKVYDLLGRTVATLVDGAMPAGVHEVRFEASHLPTGTYLVRMEAGSIVQTQRIILMK